MMSETKKKLLIVVPSLRKGGGAQRVAAFVTNNLPPAISVSVLTFERHEKEYEVPDRHTDCSDNYVDEGWFSKVEGAWGRAKSIKRVVEQEHIDTVLSFLKETAVPAVLNKLLFSSTRTVVAVRNNPLVKFNGLNGRLAIRLYRYADQVITNSRGAELICRETFHLENTSTIYNPLDVQQIKRASQEELPERYKSIFEQGITFINIGRLEPQKGQCHLIRAFTEVAQTHANAQLVILGKGSIREKLEWLITRCELEEHVHLLGRQDNVFPFLNAADCFVLSSYHEGLPNVMLEAKTVGLPIVSVDCETGPREILAPDRPIDADLTYPFQSGDHVLSEPFSGTSNYHPPSSHPLNSAERMFAQVMNTKLDQGFSNKSFDSMQRFAPDSIIEKWVDVL